jgi:glycosyltransferase involved in cell wall biosynthesis
MKIGIDISQIVYGTGVSVYTQNLVENLLKIDNKNEYIFFGASLRSKNKLKKFEKRIKKYKNAQIKLISIPPSVLEILWNRLRIFPLEKFIGKVDIFHSSDWTQPPIKYSETKKITTVHDMVPYLFPKSVHKKIINTQKRRLKIVKNEVDKIIADSNTTKEDLVKFLEIEKDKIKVVYLAPPSKFKPQSDEKITEVLKKYKIKKPYILSVATQEPRKNIQKVLKVFGEIQEKYPDLSLVLSGKYGWGTNLSTSKQGFLYPEKIAWTGYVPEEDLISLYSGCRVFVYPSFYEGFGLPILEAMACGAPVITSNNSSMAEIAKDAAILIDPRSKSQLKKAIGLILSLNMENYQKIVKASMERAKQYSWKKTAQETLEIYKKASTE